MDGRIWFPERVAYRFEDLCIHGSAVRVVVGGSILNTYGECHDVWYSCVGCDRWCGVWVVALAIAYCLLPIDYCLLTIACCLLPVAYCLLLLLLLLLLRSLLLLSLLLLLLLLLFCCGCVLTGDAQTSTQVGSRDIPLSLLVTLWWPL